MTFAEDSSFLILSIRFVPLSFVGTLIKSFQMGASMTMSLLNALALALAAAPVGKIPSKTAEDVVGFPGMTPNCIEDDAVDLIDAKVFAVEGKAIDFVYAELTLDMDDDDVFEICEADRVDVEGRLCGMMPPELEANFV